MKLENQVCNLELSKKLKELGVKQESLFYWVSIQGKYFIQHAIFVDPEYQSQPTYSAFTVAELGEGLPDNVITWRDTEKWCCVIEKPKDHDEFEDTEANARAKILIYLLKNKLVKI
jgi:hypothetical protein